jgi:hypothetical protein
VKGATEREKDRRNLEPDRHRIDGQVPNFRIVCGIRELVLEPGADRSAVKENLGFGLLLPIFGERENLQIMRDGRGRMNTIESSTVDHLRCPEHGCDEQVCLISSK